MLVHAGVVAIEEHTEGGAVTGAAGDPQDLLSSPLEGPAVSPVKVPAMSPVEGLIGGWRSSLLTSLLGVRVHTLQCPHGPGWLHGS
ncbi:hypothetical protein GCM10027586_07840 [Kineococcus gypseus]